MSDSSASARGDSPSVPSDDEGSQVSNQSRARGPYRPRDDSPSDRSDEERPAKRRIFISSKRRTTCPYGVLARQITRTINMNWDPSAVVDAGIELLALDDPHAIEAYIDAASEEKRPLYDLFLFLCDRIVGLKDVEQWGPVRRSLEDGKRAAKTEDNRTLKTSLTKCRQWDPPLKPSSKLGRGLAHLQCAHMISPISVDWSKEEQRDQFMNHNNPLPSADEDWCAFMYLDYAGNPDNLAEGLLRSDIMVWGVRTIVFPPTVANADDQADFRSNRRSKAAAYKLKKVTPGLLAYAAVCVRYALSEETTFNNDGGVFNYDQFYNGIVTHLTDPECQEDNDELMEWWNERIFPRKVTNPRRAKPSSMVARLQAQARVRAQAREQAQAQQEE